MASQPLYDALYKGIQRGIRCARDCKAFGAVLILLYAGMDAMAALGRPPGQPDVRREDFIRWVEKYVPLDGIAATELYFARCAVLHTYGVESSGSRAGKARRIGYTVGGRPPVQFNPTVAKDLALVDLPTLVETFFQGMSSFVLDLESDSKLAALVEARARELLVTIEVGP